MKKLLNFISRLPSWTLTIICIVLILWLTLSTNPLGDLSVPLFKGADKLAHAIMFGGFALAMLMDLSRRGGWHIVKMRSSVIIVVIAAGFGGLIELFQPISARSQEWADFLADMVGPLIMALLWYKIQRYVVNRG